MQKTPRIALLSALLFTILSGCTLQTSASPTTASASAALVSAASPQISAPESTPAAGQAGTVRFSAGDLLVSSSACADLDGGLVLPPNSPECDFTVALPADGSSGSVQFIPLSFASFMFDPVYWELPDPDICPTGPAFTRLPQQIITTRQYYVCYQTGEGRWGVLYIKNYDGTDLAVDWITADGQSELIAGLPVPTPQASPSTAPDAVHVQGANIVLRIDDGLELDSGTLQPATNDLFDLQVLPGEIGPDGALFNLDLRPADGSGLQVGLSFTNAPRLEDCIKVPGYSANPQRLHETRRYLCYQTSEGRLGYVYIHEANPGVGVRLDWTTWAPVLDNLVEPVNPLSALPPGHAAELAVPVHAGGLMVYNPGQLFRYTWQITNTGDSTWNSRFALVFADGTPLGGPERKQIPYPIQPGMTIKLSLNLAAPLLPGTYTVVYWLEDADGRRFGVGPDGASPLQLVINVGEPGQTLAEGQAVLLLPGYCFDLDLGYYAAGDPACDFSVNTVPDPALLHFNSPQAGFDFETLFSSPPRLGQCEDVRLSSGERLLDLHDWYVCYKTGQGRYGWLRILKTSASGLVFDWKTYR